MKNDRRSSRKKSDKQLAKGLEAAMGNVSVAARALNYSRCGLIYRIANSEYLQQIQKDLREAMTDNAESSLNRAILGGEGWAVCFYLKCQGKSRGYVERQEIYQETRLTINSPLEGMSDDELAAIIRDEQNRRSGGNATEKA